MSSSSTTAPPPYPMKLAPADHQTGKSNGCHTLFFQMFQIKTSAHQTEDPDSRLIRAETCVFLVKLPRYCRYWLLGKDMWFLEAWGEIVRKSLFVIFFMDSLSNMVLVTSSAIMVVLDYAYIPIPQKSLYGLNPKASFQMLYIWYSSSFPLLRYSSYQIMRERLLQVLTASLDPLSGWWAKAKIIYKRIYQIKSFQTVPCFLPI